MSSNNIVTKCAKLSGNGNDFIVIDNRSSRWTASELSRISRSLCRRREALGADGVLSMEFSSRLHFRMRLFNSDGSEGEMCGNGARCIARYAFEMGIAPREMTFETLAGDVQACVNPPMVALVMPEVDLSRVILDEALEVAGLKLRYSFVTVGVPHVVIFLDDLSKRTTEELTRLGREIRHRMDLFPQGANVNFVVLEREGLFCITYERGVEGITSSCGTGSVASAIISHLLGESGEKTDVRNLGGINAVSLSFLEKGRVLPALAGKTAFVARLEVLEEALADIP
ncbi:MAG: diaminopimelate epimerase [Synergistales bacterium]|nr:diaminopimelate epimerase [Synergistales bacterium]